MVYTKLRQVENFNCPVPSAKNLTWKMDLFGQILHKMSALMLENFYGESV